MVVECCLWVDSMEMCYIRSYSQKTGRSNRGLNPRPLDPNARLLTTTPRSPLLSFNQQWSYLFLHMSSVAIKNWKIILGSTQIPFCTLKPVVGCDFWANPGFKLTRSNFEIAVLLKIMPLRWENCDFWVPYWGQGHKVKLWNCHFVEFYDLEWL